jgi:hypothetical protein
MNVSGSAAVESGGISLRIVDFLEKYPHPLPIDFVAKQLGPRPERLMEDLAALETKGVVRIDAERHTVGLAVGSAKRFGLAKVFHWFSGVE